MRWVFHEDRYPCKNLIVNETQKIKCSMEFLKMCNMLCKYVDKSVDNRNFDLKFPAGSAGKFVVLGASDTGGGGSPGVGRAGDQTKMHLSHV